MLSSKAEVARTAPVTMAAFFQVCVEARAGALTTSFASWTARLIQRLLAHPVLSRTASTRLARKDKADPPSSFTKVETPPPDALDAAFDGRMPCNCQPDGCCGCQPILRS